MSDLRLDAATEKSLADGHDSAATEVTSLADTVPSTVDGGYGTAALLEIIAAVVDTADDIAVINEVAAAQVRAIGEEFGTTDEAVHDSFRRLDVVIDR